MAAVPRTELLDGDFLAARAARLRAERDEAAELLEALVEEAGGLARRREEVGTEEGFGRFDTVSLDLDRVRAEQATAEARLEEIDGALARLEHGTYGICEDCGGPVGAARLEALPEATRCISCQRRPRRRLGGRW